MSRTLRFSFNIMIRKMDLYTRKTTDIFSMGQGISPQRDSFHMNIMKIYKYIKGKYMEENYSQEDYYEDAGVMYELIR